MIITSWHWLRPYWLLCLLPWVVVVWFSFKKSKDTLSWRDVCDAHLLPAILHQTTSKPQLWSVVSILASALCLIFSLAGPTWSKWPTANYKQHLARVILLDMSDAMRATDLSPDRLSRAKFKIHDVLRYQDAGQFGLIAYTAQPFVVSPITDDGQTITSLLSSLTMDIMPVQGDRLDLALLQAKSLLAQAQLNRGEILVLTATKPSPEALNAAKNLAKQGYYTSVIPMTRHRENKDVYMALAKAGRGFYLPYQDHMGDLKQWINLTKKRTRSTAKDKQAIPVWRDEGRWFLIPALLLWLPVFRRGFMQRMPL